MTWREAFLAQARSDHGIFRSFSERASGVALCHQYHYLQMACEKLAKSHIVSGDECPRKSHGALLALLHALPQRRDYWSLLGFSSARAFKGFIKSILPVAKIIEDLAPVGGDSEKPNPEYPWRDGNGDIRCPVDYSFQGLRSSQYVYFLDFLRKFMALELA